MFPAAPNMLRRDVIPCGPARPTAAVIYEPPLDALSEPVVTISVNVALPVAVFESVLLIPEPVERISVNVELPVAVFETDPDELSVTKPVLRL